MTPGIRPLIAGNWKMHGASASLPELRAIANGFMHGLDAETDAVVCVPATLITRASEILSRTPVKTGGQDCHSEQSGPHTGDVGAEMLRDAGASFVIVGHSERRADHCETDAIVRAKAKAAWRAGLVAIICLGETQAERGAGVALRVIARQLAGSLPPGATPQNTVIAYEPVWAIGTGLTPTASDIAQAHAHLRAEVRRAAPSTADRVRLLYGGSVKPANAVEILHIDNVDGALVGGASLKAADFLAVAEALQGI